MTSDLRTEMQKRMDELVRGNANTPEQLLGPMRALLGGSTARVDVTGDVLTVSQIVEQGGVTTLDKFILDPRPVSQRPQPAPSVASRERSARKQAEDGLIGGIVDALEMQHKVTTFREQVTPASGLFYDLVSLGAQTFRELLNLNATANRRLLAALRTVVTADTASEGVQISGGGSDGPLVWLDPAGAATLVLENRRSGELGVTLPCEVSVGLAEGHGAHTLALRCKPDRVVLARGERREIAVYLAAGLPNDMSVLGGKYLGELMLQLDGGGVARVPAALTIAKGAP